MLDAVWQALDYLRQGGWVMVPLAAVSLALWTLAIDRLRAFRELDRNDIDLGEAVARITGASQAGAFDATDGESAGKRATDQGGGLRACLVGDYLAVRTGRPPVDRELLLLCANRRRDSLQRYLAVIAVLVAVAPLLGLLGTVLGMIETFDVIALFGTGNAKALASGVSVALVTTQAGLLVAIPGFFINGRLRSHAQRLVTRLDETTAVLERQLMGLPAAGS